METYGFKLTPAEERNLLRAASAEGLTVDEYIRQNLQEAGLNANASNWDWDPLAEDTLWENRRYSRPQ